MFVILLVAGLAGLVAWLLLGSRLLVVRHVEVEGTRMVPRDRVLSAAGIRVGGPMVRLDVDTVDRQVEAARGVESATITRRWPGTVRIAIRERVPVVTVERGGRFHQLDRYGVLVLEGSVRPPGLPSLLVAAPGPADPATRAALDVRQGLPERYTSRLVTIEAPTAESVTLRLSTGKTVVWGSAERAEEKLRLLDALLGTAAGRAARSIDVSAPEVVTTE